LGAFNDQEFLNRGRHIRESCCVDKCPSIVFL